MSYEEVYKKGLEVGWSGLSVQEHAVLMSHKITEEIISDRQKSIEEQRNVLTHDYKLIIKRPEVQPQRSASRN